MDNSGKRVLILTHSGGGGHLQAAIAKHQELLDDGYTHIIQKDIFIDFLGRPIGASILGAWNVCQTHGHITSLYFLSMCTRGIDFLVGIPFFFHLAINLYKYDINTIIDTQHVGTKAFIRAIRLISKWKNKQIYYEKVLTDLPSPKCRHYFKPLLKLSKKDKDFIHIATTEPDFSGSTEEGFWKKYTGLSLNNVVYKNFPLRRAFKHSYKGKKPLHLTFNTYTPEHTHLICKCLCYGSMPFKRQRNSLSFTFTDETLSLITLGSFPQKSVMIEYMLHYISQKNLYCKERKEVFFILVGPQKSSQSYYQSILDELAKIEDYPKSLTIIPLAFQDDTCLAPLYYHLDFIIAKSGGLTTMELLQSVEKNIFIHDNPRPIFSNILSVLTKSDFDTMPPWERGNANFIIAKKNAKLITPESFASVTEGFFSSALLSVQ